MPRRMIPDSATVGLWRLDEAAGGSAVDVGPNGLTGTNSGSTAVAVSGRPFAYARDFVQPSSQFIYVPYNALMNVSYVTLEFWFKLKSLLGTTYTGKVYSSPLGRITSAGAGPYYVQFNYTDKALLFRIETSGSAGRALTWTYDQAITLGLWTYLACTYDGRYNRIYQDGVQVAVLDSTSSVGIKTT